MFTLQLTDFLFAEALQQQARSSAPPRRGWERLRRRAQAMRDPSRRGRASRPPHPYRPQVLLMGNLLSWEYGMMVGFLSIPFRLCC